MFYMVELRYPVEHRDQALRYFLKHGTIGYDGKVSLAGAWVATQHHIAYAVVETQSPDELAKACAPLEQFGEVSFRPVTSVDQL
jgi:hypothetical protein